MARLPRRIGFSLLLLVAWSPAAPALDPRKGLTQYVHDSWQAEQGLPQNSVTAITQTRDGYLWLGTQEGLVRFDGVRFTVFDTRSTPELGNNFVLCLLEDRAGRLWIGTYGGLTKLESGRFTRYTTREGLPHDQVRALLEDRSGRLWIGTLGGGAIRMEAGKLVRDPAVDALPGKRIRAFAEDRHGALWMATEEGLGKLSAGVVRLYTTADGLTHKDIRALFLDRQGALWIGTDGGGLDRLAHGAITALTAKDGLPHDLVRSLHGDAAGNLFVGTWGGGLGRLSNGRLTAITAREGLASDQIWTIYEDREGSLWVGTDAGGLHRFKDGAFTAMTTREGLTNDVAMSLLEDRSGALWVGTYGGGLDRLAPDGTVTAFTTANGLPHDTVQALHEGRDGTLWIGTSGGGLGRLSRGTLTALTTRDGLTSDLVRSLLEDRAGTLWIGTDGGGLCRLRDGTITAVTPRDGSPFDVVLCLLEDRSGNLWIGTDGGGLGLLSNGRLTARTTREGMSNDIVSALHEDRDGTLWIGTSGGGLGRLKGGRLAWVSRKEGLFDDTVFSILEDDAGQLWMSCNKGIFRASRQELEDVMDGKRPAVASIAYGTADGMKSAECNAGTPAGWKARDGRFWFGTLRGAVAVDPRRVAGNPLPPPVVIEEVLVDGRLSARAGPLRLPAGTRSVEVHYTGLSLLSPSRVRFRYQLAGFDPEWVDAGTRRTAYFTNLPHGEYSFRVKACNNDGLWNEEGASLAFTVEPRFHETGLFRLLAALAAVAVPYGAYRARLWRVRARERELVALVEERTRNLRAEKERTEAALAEAEEHERRAEAASQAKSVFLANMSHELRTPLNAVLGFNQLLERDPAITGESREGLAIIQRSGEHLLGLINDVLSISKIEAGRLSLEPRPFQLKELLSAVHAMVRVRAESKDLPVVFELDPGLPDVVLGDDGKLRQVLVNLLGNAVKFTERGHVSLRARWESGRARFEVEDTGPGIAPAELATLFAPFVQTESGRKAREGTGLGLAISRQIVNLMGGDVSVTSTPGQGTTFRVEVDLPESELVARPERGRVVGLAEGQERCRVLVVDDTDENRLLLTRLLRSIGFEVREAANGALAIEEWQSFKPHAIFMDMRMPVMDGVEAARRIRALEEARPRPGGRTIILALTASVFEHERTEILASGSDDFIMKPFRVETVLEKLGTHLGLRYLHEPERASAAPAAGAGPASPGLDVADGLRRAGGRLDLYRRLVTGFVKEASDTVPRLHDLLGRGERSEALRLLHTLKGTASTLGARRVARAAAALESTVAGGAEARPQLDGLGASVEEMGRAAGLLGGGDARETAEPLTPERARAALAITPRLAGLLAAGDLTAADCVAELRQALGPSLGAPLRDLERAIDRLDFEAAASLLSAIDSDLSAASA